MPPRLVLVAEIRRGGTGGCTGTIHRWGEGRRVNGVGGSARGRDGSRSGAGTPRPGRSSYIRRPRRCWPSVRTFCRLTRSSAGTITFIGSSARTMDDLDLDTVPLPPSTSGYRSALLYRTASMGRWKRYDFGKAQPARGPRTAPADERRRRPVDVRAPARSSTIKYPSTAPFSDSCCAAAGPKDVAKCRWPGSCHPLQDLGAERDHLRRTLPRAGHPQPRSSDPRGRGMAHVCSRIRPVFATDGAAIRTSSLPQPRARRQCAVRSLPAGRCHEDVDCPCGSRRISAAR